MLWEKHPKFNRIVNAFLASFSSHLGSLFPSSMHQIAEVSRVHESSMFEGHGSQHPPQKRPKTDQKINQNSILLFYLISGPTWTHNGANMGGTISLKFPLGLPWRLQWSTPRVPKSTSRSSWASKGRPKGPPRTHIDTRQPNAPKKNPERAQESKAGGKKYSRKPWT